MTRRQDRTESDREPEFQVRPTKQARRDCDDLFQSQMEILWVISQLKLLKHWPLDAKRQEELGVSLDSSKVRHNGEMFYELRLDDARLHQRNLRVFFWLDDDHNTIWIIHAYWKKTNRIEEVVKTLVARRIKSLRSGTR